MVLSAAALVINRLPAGYAVPLAGLAGVVNARAWYGVTTALAGPLSARSPGAPPGRPRARRGSPAPRRLPIAPVAAVLAIGLVIGVARAGFAVVSAPHHQGGTQAQAAVGPRGVPPSSSADSAPAGAGRPSPVLEIEGFGSSCCS